MSKAILHIGTHKTGTSSLQDAFFMHRMSLQHYGIIYPQVGNISGHHALAANWITLPAEFNIPGGLENWQRTFQQLADADLTLFISSEELSRAHPDRVDMPTLASLVSSFDEVQVVCTLRHQVDLVESSLSEALKKTESPVSLAQFMETALAEHLADGIFLDYNDLYDHLLTGFEPGGITFLSYEQACSQANGVIGAYLDMLDSDLPDSLVNQMASFRSNTSVPALHLWTAASVATSLPPDTAEVAAVTNWLGSRFGDNCTSSLLTATEHEDLVKTFTPLNRRFEARVAEYQPGFSLASPPNREVDVDRNEISEDLLDQLRGQLESTTG